MGIGRGFIVGVTIVLGAALAVPATVAAAAQTATPRLKYTAFDYPRALYTDVTGVNIKGMIAGYYGDASGQHGFIFGPKTKVTINVPGSSRLVVTSINDGGTVTGSYWIGSKEYGFIADSTGHIISTLDNWGDVPPGYELGTFASQINNSGVVVGYYFKTQLDSTYSDGSIGPSTLYHGFVWTAATGFTSYDAPGAGTDATGEPQVGTRLFGLNNSGDIVGSYTYLAPNPFDPTVITGVTPGFELSGVTVTPTVNLASPPATFTEFIDPVLTKSWCSYTNPTAINDDGIVVGNAANGCAPGYFVFEWANGIYSRINSYNAPGAARTATVLNSINDNGVVGGTWRTWAPSPDGPVAGPDHGLTASLP